MHWFRKQAPIVRTMVGFVVIATLLCLLFGPIGILYALGFEVLYLLTLLWQSTVACGVKGEILRRPEALNLRVFTAFSPRESESGSSNNPWSEFRGASSAVAT